MITQRDITKLKKVFVTRFDLVEKRLDKIEATQQKILEKLDSMEKFMKLMSIKLLDHEKRLVTLESKILLS